MSKKFKTLLPVDRAAPGLIVGTTDYADDEVCGSCRLKIVCEIAKKSLPLEVLAAGNPEMVHDCAKGTQVQIFDVRHSDKPAVEEKSKSEKSGRLYLLDANIFIFALNGDRKWGKISGWVINRADIRVATTKKILDEVHNMSQKMLDAIDIVFEVDEIMPELMETKPQYGKKEPSISDLSLIQAAMNNEEVDGIITLDTDFKNIAAAGVVRLETGRRIEVLTPEELKSKIVKPSRR